MTKKKVHTDKAPAAIGPYSQAIRCGNLLFCSGQIPLNPDSGQLVVGSIEEETHRVLVNLKAVLKAAGSDMQDVLKTTIYLTDLNDFQRVNEVYGQYFPEPFPARVCIAAKALPKGANVEIDAIAQVLN